MRTTAAVVFIFTAAATHAAEAVRAGSQAYGDWSADAPGVRRLITPADLPPPFATRSAANPPGPSAARERGSAPRLEGISGAGP